MKALYTLRPCHSIGIALVFSMLSACSGTTTTREPRGPEVMVFSEPEGAMLFDTATGAELGTAPLHIFMGPEDMRAVDGQDTCYLIKGMSARWGSGAEAEFAATISCGYELSLLIARRCAFPGLERDLEVAVAAARNYTARERSMANTMRRNAELNRQRGLPQLDENGDIIEGGLSPFCDEESG